VLAMAFICWVYAYDPMDVFYGVCIIYGWHGFTVLQSEINYKVKREAVVWSNSSRNRCIKKSGAKGWIDFHWR
jgi:hypothetical protein